MGPEKKRRWPLVGLPPAAAAAVGVRFEVRPVVDPCSAEEGERCRTAFVGVTASDTAEDEAEATDECNDARLLLLLPMEDVGEANDASAFALAEAASTMFKRRCAAVCVGLATLGDATSIGDGEGGIPPPAVKGLASPFCRA